MMPSVCEPDWVTPWGSGSLVLNHQPNTSQHIIANHINFPDVHLHFVASEFESKQNKWASVKWLKFAVSCCELAND
jgi:hypothetical protein